ncbi:DNA-binding domain-containing protein [Marinifilum sp. D714]|uniref:HU family DNA-binding protein n=1 Tax=Marinifilum sp. D714 TaxID=2937523 RepID=UPI0027CE1B15|nr:DNA-binding domain-containing protein [Marinifilum sp. D714]MDQ2177178.1 HU family DNA-binding protein [Marinifilum sp. D714]
MSIEFKALPIRNPNLRKNAKAKYYPQICRTRKIDIEKMCNDISRNTSLNEHAIRHVLFALESQIANYMEEGYSVDIPGIGIIYPSISGEPSDTPEGVKADKIKKVNIKFRPAKRLKQAIKHVEFKKVKKSKP